MMHAFAHGPTVIAAFDNDVHFLPFVLTHVTRPHHAGLAIPTVAPRIAETVSVNLFAHAIFLLFGHEGVILRDAVRKLMAVLAIAYSGTGVDIDAKNFGEQGGGVLSVAVRVVGRAAVTEREIQIAIGSETDLAAFVVAVRLRDFQENALGREVGFVGIGGRDLEFADDAAARVLLIVINVKQPVRFELWVKRKAQQ